MEGQYFLQAVFVISCRPPSKVFLNSGYSVSLPSTVKDIADAVLYLTDAATVTGDILYVDGGAHFGRW
jgi:hypothetical protein